MGNTAEVVCHEIENESNEKEAGRILAERLERKNLILCRGCLDNRKDAMDQTF